MKKQLVYQVCVEHCEKEISALQSDLKDLYDSLKNESKSTAGDKHETGRAMMHLEIEKKGKQLQVLQQIHKTIEQLSPDAKCHQVEKGSLVQTNFGWFYMAASLGEIQVEQEKVFVMSSASPLAKAFWNKTKGDEIAFNGRKYRIKQVE